MRFDLLQWPPGPPQFVFVQVPMIERVDVGNERMVFKGNGGSARSQKTDFAIGIALFNDGQYCSRNHYISQIGDVAQKNLLRVNRDRAVFFLPPENPIPNQKDDIR